MIIRMDQAGWVLGWKARDDPKILPGKPFWGDVCLRRGAATKNEGAGEDKLTNSCVPGRSPAVLWKSCHITQEWPRSSEMLAWI